MLPALKDPRHASRQEALGYFGKSTAWLSLRFIWAEKYKLPITDAIKLLGGRENTVFVQFLIACLEKDQPKALKLYNQLGRENTLDYQRLQASCLYSRMHPLGPERVEKDLKPEGAVSIRKEVQRKLGRVSI